MLGCTETPWPSVEHICSHNTPTFDNFIQFFSSELGHSEYGFIFLWANIYMPLCLSLTMELHLMRKMHLCGL